MAPMTKTIIRTLLCPVDFSEHSDRAVTFALGLAHQLGGRLDLLHVYPVPYYNPPHLGPELNQQILEDYKEMGRQALHEFLARLEEPPTGVELAGHLVKGEPHEEICRFAEACGADLVVMATHGRTGLTRLLMGSVTERVIRTSSVPVLTVPIPRQA